MSERRSRHIWRWALLASLALHLGLLLLWARQPPPPAVVPPPRVVDFELHEITRPKRPEPAKPPPAPRPAERPAEAKRKPTPAYPGERLAASPPAQPAERGAAPSVGEAPSRLEAKPPSPGQATGPGQAQAGPEPFLVKPNAPDFRSAGTEAAGRVAQSMPAPGLPPAPGLQDRSIQAPEQDPDVNRRVAGLIDGDRGKRRVDRGMIDPYFNKLGKALVDGWKSDKNGSADPGYLKDLADNAKEFLSGYAQAASEYGRTGKIGVGERVGDGLDDMREKGIAMEATRYGATRRGTLVVRLTQALNGRLLRVDLVSPSDNPALDAEVMRELRNGDMAMPVPPASGGLGIHEPIHSTWAFQLSVTICPPAPVLIGSFDVDAIFDKKMGPIIDVCVPLDKRVHKHVELLEVD